MVRATALVLTALTGFSALVYEVAWQKYVATLLGSHSEATAAVLAIFLGGLSVGYALFGRLSRRLVSLETDSGDPPVLLRRYGVVEAGIGLHALIFPWLFTAVRSVSFAIPHEVSGLGFALDVGLVALLILPPTVLMGGTIPLLTQALATSLADATRFHALVYAFNTTGAFAGALLAGFLLIPLLGLELVVLAMGAVNLTAGAIFVVLGSARGGVSAPVDLADGRGAPLGVFGVVALLSGFSAMALQTVVIRVSGFAIGSSEFTFSMVVAIFILCIALGSFAVSALRRIPRGLLVIAQWMLVGLLLLLYRVLPDTPYWVHVVRSGFGDADFHLYYFTLFVFALGALIAPIGLSGATLPLIFHQLRGRFGDLGGAAGRLYALNTLGSLLGALLGGYLLLFWLNLDQVYAVALGAVIVGAVLLTVSLLDWPRATVLLLLPILAMVGWLPRWSPDRLSSGLFRLRAAVVATSMGPDAMFAQLRPDDRVAFYGDDPASSVAVYQTLTADGHVSNTAIFTNGKPEASTGGDYATMAMAALLPALFSESAEKAFVIGFGSGVTVGELAALESVQKVVVAEISPGVIEAGPLFEHANQGALSNPKTEVVLSDAFRALQRSDEEWDVIASEPSNPWVTGIEMLYSREFLEVARDQLRPGGVYAQWLHLYEIDDEVVSLVLRTYASVFDHVAIWYTVGTDVILLGFDSDAHALDLGRLHQRASAPDFSAGLRRAGIDGFPRLLAHEVLPLDVLHGAGLEGDVHTLLHPVLNHRATRAFFAGHQGRLPPMLRPVAATTGAENSLLARYAREQGGRLSEGEYGEILDEACSMRPVHCATFLAKWEMSYPGSELRRKRLDQLRSNGGFASHLTPARLQLLEYLLGRDARPRGRVQLADARYITELFVHYYSYFAPFDRRRLADVWSRCRDHSGGADCIEARALVEGQIGELVASATP